MALKLPDSAVPMGDFPVAKAVDIDFDDGENLQDKFDNGELGGGAVTSNQLSLVANSQYFKISITKNHPSYYGSLKFSYTYGITPIEVDITITPALNYIISKGSNTISSITYTIDGANITIGIKCTVTMYGTQTVEMPSEFGTINSLTNEEFTGDTTATLKESDGRGVITSLSQLGLTAPVSIGEAFNAMPDKTTLMLNVNNVSDADATVTDAPHNQGVLVINKHNNGRFSIEFNYSLGSNGNTIRKWIGTLKGSDGTGLNWKEVAYLNDHAMKSYSSLLDLGLDTTATINDIVGKMVSNSMFVYKTDVFDLTQYENLQLATVTIIKHSTNRVQAIMTDRDTGDLYIGRMGSGNKIIGWRKMITDKSDPYACTSYTALTGTEDLFTLPCGHYVSANINTTYNYPVTDSDKATAHIYVLGCLNEPANNKGYRIILYFDNKGRMYRINEWWGSFSNGWQQIDATGTVEIIANTTNYKITLKRKNANWYGFAKVEFVNGNTVYTINLSVKASEKKPVVVYSVTPTFNIIDSVTYDGDTTSETFSIGIKLKATSYGAHKLIVPNGWADIILFSENEYIGATTATSEPSVTGYITNPLEIGLTEPTTAMAIYKAMPKYTTFVYGLYGTTAITGLPDANGLLEITKGGGDGSRGTMTFTQSAGNTAGYKKKWVGEFKANNTDTSDGAVIWHQLAFQSDLDGLFQSVSDGKTLVANAITDKGVSTATDATFATMATNVSKITNYTASEKQALATAITNKGVSTSSTASFATMATNVGKITNYTASEKQALATAITNKGVSTSTDATFATMATNVSKITNYTASEKQALATAITNKGVSTSSTASFATMATNISKISGGYKEETKSLIVTSGSTGTEALRFTFSANVIAVKQIVAPSDSCLIVSQTSKDMFKIEGKELIVYATGTGTWKATALIEK